jgi:multiple sugar transport system substrate-binding protein
MDIVWIAQFAASGWLEPLAPYAQEDAMDLGVFFPNVLDLADRYEGSLVALPVYVDGGLLYYREDLLGKAGGRRPPQLWSELVEQSMSIQEQARDADPGFYAFVWQGAQYEGLVCNFLEFCASNGGGILIEDGRVVLDTPENRAAARFMVDLIHTFKVSPPSTFTQMREEDVRIFFQQGDAAFERNWPYAWPLHQNEGSPVRGRTGIAPLPHFPNGKTVSTLGGWHVGVSKYSDEKALGWELVKFLVSYETQKKLALELGWNPGRRDLYDDREVLRRLPHFAELGEIFEHALPRPTVPYYAQLSEVIQRHVSAMLAGATAPEAALAAAEREAQRVIDRYEKK